VCAWHWERRRARFVRFVLGQSLATVAFGLVVGAGLVGTRATVLMPTSARRAAGIDPMKTLRQE
jgi:hypothetical protein